MHRFNDVIADPEGRVFAGTLGDHPRCGLYRIDLDGVVTHLFSGTGCSNGMGFSTDLKTFYWTCSTTRHIFQFDYQRATGDITNRRIFYKAAPTEGIPDGLAVDSDGYVWSARWGSGSIVRHAPDGKVAARLCFPAPRITSMCFGGEKLDELFVTSAKEEKEQNRPGGVLFKVRLQARGTNEFKSRIAIGRLAKRATRQVP